MKIKKCPYCGKRISYVSSYASRRKGEYVCVRCGKESKVVISKKVMIVFAVAVLISLGIMAGWIFAGLLNNPLGILLVAIPLIIFVVLTPKFVFFEPLKKYKKSMEAKKEGIAYSDNLITSELDESDTYSFPTVSVDTGGFQINADVFNKIKAERNETREKLSGNDIVSDSGSIQNENYVSIKSDISQNHISSDVPLKKIHSEPTIRRSHHYMPSDEIENKGTQERRNDSNKYSSNRKF